MDVVLQMKGEKELVEKILQTEIKIFNAIRDGSALMQHMEDFYYITLLEVYVTFKQCLQPSCCVEHVLALTFKTVNHIIYLLLAIFSECEVELHKC